MNSHIKFDRRLVRGEINTFSDINMDYSCSKAGINIITKTLGKFNKDIRIKNSHLILNHVLNRLIT